MLSLPRSRRRTSSPTMPMRRSTGQVPLPLLHIRPKQLQPMRLYHLTNHSDRNLNTALHNHRIQRPRRLLRLLNLLRLRRQRKPHLRRPNPSNLHNRLPRLRLLRFQRLGRRHRILFRLRSLSSIRLRLLRLRRRRPQRRLLGSLRRRLGRLGL